MAHYLSQKRLLSSSAIPRVPPIDFANCKQIDALIMKVMLLNTMARVDLGHTDVECSGGIIFDSELASVSIAILQVISEARVKSVTTKTRIVLTGIAIGAALLVASPGFAAAPKMQTSELNALKEEVERLRGEIEAMRNDLRQLSQRLAGGGQAQAPRRATVTTGGGVAMGKDNAPLTLVEFSDYQCPFCRRFHEQTLARLKTQYIDTGKVRYVFRDYPLDSIHPQARKASEAAHCAADQDKYWQAHDLLFENQERLQPENLKSYAEKLGLKTDAFNECLDKEKYKQRVQENQDDGVKAGVRGTPAFFLGKSGKDGSVDGLLISGAQPFENFQQEIDRLLAENRAQ